MKTLSYILLLTFSTHFSSTKIWIQVNDELPIYESTVRIIEGEHIVLQTEASGNWVEIKPVLKEYDNLSDGIHKIKAIDYKVNKIGVKDNEEKLKLESLVPGTHYYGRFKKSVTSFTSKKPIHLESDSIVQIIVRKDNSYTGVLTELLNLPFIIPPKVISDYGHQTDLCIGTDCAELAIYGMRRLGYKIPYCGPKNIYKYTKKTSEVKSGILLHFGFQVSVLYKDKGIVGVLDKEDLLIHAFEDKVEIIPFGHTKLSKLPYKLYEWKF